MESKTQENISLFQGKCLFSNKMLSLVNIEYTINIHPSDT